RSDGNRIAVRDHNLDLLFPNDTTSRPFVTDISEIILENGIYSTAYLQKADGKYIYAVGTHQKGIFILNEEGELLFHLNRENGLLDNDVTSLYFDETGFLWTTTGKGVSKIALQFPITKFGAKQNIESRVSALRRGKDGILYAGTNAGLFAQKENRFEPVEGVIGTQCWEIQDFEGGVIVAGGNSGFFHVKEGVLLQNVQQDWATMAIGRSRQDSSIVFQACFQGFYILKYQQGRFQQTKSFPELDTVVSRSVEEDKLGNVWVGAPSDGFYHFSWKDGKLDTSLTKITKGLTEISSCYVVPFGEELLFFSGGNPYTFDAKKEVFTPYETDWVKELEQPIGSDIFKDRFDNIWASNQLTGFENPNYIADTESLKPILAPTGSFWADADSIFWFGNLDGVFRFDPKWQFEQKDDFKTVIRSVTSGDSLITDVQALSYEQNNLRFSYSAHSYFEESENEYQYKLGNASWSAWTKETFKEYTNLWEGNYTFSVRSRNALGQIGETADLAFQIQPPIYRTAWAYVIYALLLLGLILGLVRLNSRRLKRKNEQLESVVQERTLELQQQKEEITIQAEHVKQINEELTQVLEVSEQQKEELARQNQNIQDSIQYAQRIQAAILPFEQ
ncbi:MAG: hypothetical protein AAF740_14775, partial [Bacteroidota bacterium]